MILTLVVCKLLAAAIVPVFQTDWICLNTPYRETDRAGREHHYIDPVSFGLKILVD